MGRSHAVTKSCHRENDHAQAKPSLLAVPPDIFQFRRPAPCSGNANSLFRQVGKAPASHSDCGAISRPASPNGPKSAKFPV
jgi:hypothetical protein